MIWKLLADATVALHILWVLAVILGPFWAWRRPGFRAGHLFLLLVTFLVSASGFYCPLMLMETSLRMHYDPSSAYAEGFLAHYLNALVSWDVEPMDVFMAILVWTLLWAGIYVFLWMKERRGRLSSR